MEIERTKLKPEPSVSPPLNLVRRENWRRFRAEIEHLKAKSNITRYFSQRHWYVFIALVKFFGFLTWLSRLSVLGNKKALDLKLNSFDIEIPDLPKEFDGFEIVHITDLHFDRVKGVEDKIVKLLEGRNPDVIVFTGDYKDRMNVAPIYYEPAFRLLGSRLKAKQGVFAVLGNHDTADLVPLIEKCGIKMLINESVELMRGSHRVTLTGVDDVHYYFSPAAIQAMEEAPQNACKIILVHSPEMVREAAERKYSLYLSGHTHAGQIATPGGRAIITHLDTGKEFAVGRWSYKGLEGYTSSGAGVSGLTLRFFTQSEIALIRLKVPC